MDLYLLRHAEAEEEAASDEERQLNNRGREQAGGRLADFVRETIYLPEKSLPAP